MPILEGEIAGGGSSVIVGEWLECPGQYYEFMYALKLQNTGDEAIVIDSIEFIGNINSGLASLDSYQWVDPVDRVKPNTPAEGCNGMRLCPGCVSEVDEWVEGAEEKANLLSGLIGAGGGFDPGGPSWLHSFNAPTELWDTGGLVVEPGGWLTVACSEEAIFRFDLSPFVSTHEIEIAGVLPALVGSMAVEAFGISKEIAPARLKATPPMPPARGIIPELRLGPFGSIGDLAKAHNESQDWINKLVRAVNDLNVWRETQ